MRKFVWILAKNIFINGVLFPAAWELSNRLAKFLSRKDEKIVCLPDQSGTLISLYFRKDTQIDDQPLTFCSPLQDTWAKIDHIPKIKDFPEWFILKPKPRKKSE